VILASRPPARYAGGLSCDAGELSSDHPLVFSSDHPLVFIESVHVCAGGDLYRNGHFHPGCATGWRNRQVYERHNGTADGGVEWWLGQLYDLDAAGGTNYIKAAYGGDANFAGSKSNTVSQVVNKATTTSTLASSRNPSNFEQFVTFTASVASFSGTVKGSVTFYDGTTVLKTDVGLSAGVAKYTTSTLSDGTHTITATYKGNANFIGSSASLTQTVN
jgi:Bacterial Ig-like domain (group 3)